MARNHYTITFRDGVVVYALVGSSYNLGHSIPSRSLNHEQMEYLNRTFFDIAEFELSLTEEEYWYTLRRDVPVLLPILREQQKYHRSNFAPKPHNHN